jgi:hypothetical protein
VPRIDITDIILLVAMSNAPETIPAILLNKLDPDAFSNANALHKSTDHFAIFRTYNIRLI